MGVSFDFSKKFEVDQIKKFRNFINGNNYFVLNKYKNINSKNRWSIICSCMDWITVAVDFINSTEIKNKSENIMSMQVYTMISSYDIIIDAIIQLHRVFFNTRNSPFENDRSIFKEKLTDEKYFKHIRAVFGAHPVNLDDIYDSNSKKKYFASWASARAVSKYDMHVFLYSNIPGEPAKEFGIEFYLIHELVLKYYNYLNIIVEEIKKQYEGSLCEKRAQVIEKKQDILEQIEVLKNERKLRFNDCYSIELDELEMMFNSRCTFIENQSAFNEYLKELEKVVEELHSNLQSMKFGELETDYIINPGSSFDRQYDYEKVFNYIYGDDDNLSYHMFPNHYKRIQVELLGIKTFDSSLSKNELLLTIKAGLYFKEKQKKVGERK
ncbi:hypothetical protein [Clostridium sp.]|uniref:hypothetical protein n=1 Tax=Clostridium sp. TaxID=1506 RepID=UPI001A4C0C11|nr:hypothetical protein [Clostridium sp.]MBK5241109.1 hypothetical protein [Clostridium sp.]